MEFDPNNKIVRLCLQGMGMEEGSKPEEAGNLFLQAWNEATNDLEKFIASHFVACYQKDVSDKLKWFKIALQLALKINNNTAKSAFPSLYKNIAKCYEELGDNEQTKDYEALSRSFQKNLQTKALFIMVQEQTCRLVICSPQVALPITTLNLK